ncbi:alpha/beta hydrolase [Undibacterium sp. TJN25]|uniref:alpha/beta hydrolase n=1 Tax=Undibacterium sp. TJN25 TaxID=3413056 RepID=UPI003BF009CE
MLKNLGCATLLAASAVAVGTAAAAPMSLKNYMDLQGPEPDVHLAYGTQPSQFVELFKPEGHGPFPVAIVIHGGCWTVEFGGIKQMHNVAGDLARRGIAVWNVEYRRVDEEGGGYPGTYQDISAALNLLQASAGKYGLDANRVVAIGHSAGGQLAQWAAARKKLPVSSPLYQPDPLPIPVVISLGGLADLRREEKLIKSSCDRDMVQLTGTPSTMRPDVFSDTSSAEMLPVGGSTILINGELDTVSPPRVGEDYAKRAREAGDHAEAIILTGASHYDEIAATSPSWKIVLAHILKALGMPQAAEK